LPVAKTLNSWILAVKRALKFFCPACREASTLYHLSAFLPSQQSHKTKLYSGLATYSTCAWLSQILSRAKLGYVWLVNIKSFCLMIRFGYWSLCSFPDLIDSWFNSINGCRSQGVITSGWESDGCGFKPYNTRSLSCQMYWKRTQNVEIKSTLQISSELCCIGSGNAEAWSTSLSESHHRSLWSW